MTKKQKKEKGDLVKVIWHDAQGFVNEALDTVKVEKAISWGILLEETDDQIKLCSSIYPEDTKKNGDFSAIPAAWIDDITIIKKKAYPGF